MSFLLVCSLLCDWLGNLYPHPIKKTSNESLDISVGFLSAQGSQRRNRLVVAANETSTQVLYVPPHKLCRVLEDCIAVFGGSR